MQEQSAKILDRRIFERIPAKLPVKFLDPTSSIEGFAQTQDISAQGIGMVTDKELLPDTPLIICLQLPNSDLSLYTSGKVVWSKVIEPNRCRAGICLDKPVFVGMSLILEHVLRETYAQ